MNIRVWSPEEEQELVRMYCDEDMDVLSIAEYFGKNNRSIISKLVQLKVYRKPEVDKKNKRSVKSMIIELEKTLDISLDGVNLSRKSNLEILVDAIKLRFDLETEYNKN
jgi:transposase-like protein